MKCCKSLKVGMLVLFVMELLTSVSYAENILPDSWRDLSPTYNNYEWVKVTPLVRGPEGGLWRISQTESAEYPFVPIYWGEDTVTSVLTGIRTMWEETKGYLKEILDKIRSLMGLLGVLVLLVSSGILTYFINTTFPAFSKKWVFYSVFALISIFWIYLTSMYSSVLYAAGILVLPHMVIGLMGALYIISFGRLRNRNRVRKNGRIIR